MKMEVLAVQQQYQSQYNIYGSSKVRDWTSTLTPLMPLTSYACIDAETEASHGVGVPTATASIPIPYLSNSNNNNSNNSHAINNNNCNNVSNKNLKNSIMHNKKTKRTASTDELLVPEVLTPPVSTQSQTQLQSNSYNNINNINNSSIIGKLPAARSASAPTVGGSYLTTNHSPQNGGATANLFYCDEIDAAAVDELSLRILNELRAAKSRHLTCTEVSLPCDLTPRIAAEIIRVSEKEPCGIRGCTIYIEFEDEPNNSRRIAELKLDAEMVSTFEVYLTLRQDHRGWTSLLPQFMKSLARTITISPSFTITKHKLYSTDRSSYSYGSSSSAAISTPSS